MWVAFALAVAIHEVVAGLLPHTPAPTEQPEKVTALQIVRIEHRSTPRPKPTPTPRPIVRPRVLATPRPVVASISPAHASKPRAAHREGIAKSIPHTQHHAPRVEHFAVANRIGTGHRGSGTGSGGVNGAGSGAGGNGNGTGAGGNGNGTAGQAAGNEPCGFVSFVNIRAPKYAGGAFYQDIRAMVTFADRHQEGVELDYPFYYASETAFPWSDQNLKNDKFEVPFQFPPAEKRASEPPLVQYIMTHTDTAGFTKFKNCPWDTGAP
ncbi:MAG: hypothetical protein DLM50_08510 [Candidatus Meridianibacter frigidus]|nr:MAG: hypothetical protein DLM50_08510 [Candidatus Eremiobacteraeota bacterium]